MHPKPYGELRPFPWARRMPIQYRGGNGSILHAPFPWLTRILTRETRSCDGAPLGARQANQIEDVRCQGGASKRRDLAERIGGSLAPAPSEPGGGARFVLRLPPAEP